MKKGILMMLMVSLIALAGCAKGQTQEPVQTPNEENTEVAKEEVEAPASNIGNPWVDCTEEDILEKLDYYMFAPDDAKDVKCQLNESNDMAQMTFKYGEPELEYTYRIKKSSEFEDISGLYYEWTVDEEQQVGWCNGVCKRYVGDTETIDLCMWYDEDIELMYSLSTSAADLDGFDDEIFPEKNPLARLEYANTGISFFIYHSLASLFLGPAILTHPAPPPNGSPI